MKVCVYFVPNAKKDNFEGTRLRKSIKGSLELINLPYAKSIDENYDLAHFISLKDEFKIIDLKERNVPVVFSALMCESDENAKIMEIKNGVNTISPRAIRILNKVDRVFVCDETSKNLLLRSGVTTKISIIPAGVNLSRFEFTNQVEDEIFYQYYQLEKDSKFVVAVGSYKNKESVKKFVEIARRCPKYLFYYFGPDASAFRIWRITHKLPKNVKLNPIMNDEIYCSMMKNAGVYLMLDNSVHSPITLLDAAASKTQIVALKPLNYNEELLKEMRAYMCEDIIDVAKTINGLFSNDVVSTVKDAYKFAKNNSLMVLGEKLKTEYEDVLKEVNTK